VANNGNDFSVQTQGPQHSAAASLPFLHCSSTYHMIFLTIDTTTIFFCAGLSLFVGHNSARR